MLRSCLCEYSDACEYSVVKGRIRAEQVMEMPAEETRR